MTLSVWVHERQTECDERSRQSMMNAPDLFVMIGLSPRQFNTGISVYPWAHKTAVEMQHCDLRVCSTPYITSCANVLFFGHSWLCRSMMPGLRYCAFRYTRFQLSMLRFDIVRSLDPIYTQCILFEFMLQVIVWVALCTWQVDVVCAMPISKLRWCMCLIWAEACGPISTSSSFTHPQD